MFWYICDNVNVIFAIGTDRQLDGWFLLPLLRYFPISGGKINHPSNYLSISMTKIKLTLSQKEIEKMRFPVHQCVVLIIHRCVFGNPVTSPVALLYREDKDKIDR